MQLTPLKVAGFKGSRGTKRPAEKPSTAPRVAAETRVLVEQIIKENGGLPDDRANRQELIKGLIDLTSTTRREEEEEADLASFNFKTNISQQDEAWINKREFFVNELMVSTKTPVKIFDEALNKTQRLYLMPKEGEGGMILKIQEEHTKEYKEGLGPAGRFCGVPDNLATKLTMLYFGLPIEPITLDNVIMCGNEDDKNCDPDDPPVSPTVQRVTLEFLDNYGNGRSYGFPKLRSEYPQPVFVEYVADLCRSQTELY
jgi:hypothetical protein